MEEEEGCDDVDSNMGDEVLSLVFRLLHDWDIREIDLRGVCVGGK